MALEQWKDIGGYEGMYAVSNLGRVKSLPRLTKHRFNDFMSKELILKPAIVKGYQKVTLRKSGAGKIYAVHRLVLGAFVKNVNELPSVDHINNIPTDNRLENLQWISIQDNIEKRELDKLK
tara:strand:+ start:22 stop:384 length:363 start_codon:yes stop_codon:yes gene_type:complete